MRSWSPKKRSSAEYEHSSSDCNDVSKAGQDEISASRRGFATLCLASVASTAGCLDAFGDDSNGENDDDLPEDSDEVSGESADEDATEALPEVVPGDVPKDVDGIFAVTDRMIDTESAAAGLTVFLDTVTEQINDNGILAAYRDLLVELGDTTINHTKSTLFYRDDTAPYAAVIIGTDDDQAALLDWIADRFEEVDETTDGNVDISVGERDGVTEWLAPLGDEHLILGTEPATKEWLDVYRGDADPFDGELQTTHERASDGEMNATMVLDGIDIEQVVGQISTELATGLGLLEEPEIVSLTYRFDDDETDDVQFDLQLTMENEDEAESVAGVVAVLIEDEDELPIDVDEVLLDGLSVDTTGRYVTLSLATTVDEFRSFVN